MSAVSSVHLVVLVHGMWGNPSHLAELNSIILETCASEPSPTGERVLTLSPKSNSESGTYDGIDWCGERVAEEVCAWAFDAVRSDELMARGTGSGPRGSQAYGR